MNWDFWLQSQHFLLNHSMFTYQKNKMGLSLSNIKDDRET